MKTALRSFTMWGARQLFLENEIGSLEVGKYADIAVWTVNPYTAPVDALETMSCSMTLMNGKIVYEKK